MSPFYIICRTYTPNSAGVNRLLSFVKSLSDRGIDTKVLFFSPDTDYSKINGSYPHIEFIYKWDKYYIKNSILKYLSFLLYILGFVIRLPGKSKILIFGFSEILPFLLRRRDCDIFYEISENPEISLTTNRFFASSLNSFLKNSQKLDGLFVISNALKEYFCSKGVDTSKIHIINMTVDKTRFEGVQKQNGERYIAYCGTASNNKDGVDQLIKSFALISDKYLELKLFIIGKIPSERESFGNKELVNQLGISNKVVFTGVVASTEIPQMLTNAEILALDRPENIQAKYGFPTKLGEYLLTGNPVVITRVGDIPLFLKDGVNALIAEPDCPESFAGKLDWALSHKEEVRKIGLAGKQVALQSFDAAIETEKIISIIGLI